ncbi:hypothetical protein LCGC14_1824680 [marine sediment metagenome]|uniref:ABC transporter domain-containing protein n=1 Tax=marine sediment metagenome TaxID=412755 RepID=A0A0F9H635_9ZZZZ
MKVGVILQASEISKHFVGVQALDRVQFELKRGEVHALVGENGAGKTTLMKILFGITHAQQGAIFYINQGIKVKNPHEAIKLGIGMVHQHLMLAPDLTVAENMVLGVEPLKGKILLDTNKAIEITKQVSAEYGLDVPANRKIKDLPIGIRQRVEILKALFRNAELLILDEPTSVLTPQESEILFRTLKELKNHGKTIIFISHKLKEVKQIADRITIMRDARVITTKDAGELTEHDIAYLMVGREISFTRVRPPEKRGETFLSVHNLSYLNDENTRILKNISFEVNSGEILGLAGVEGNGQTELVQALTGLLEPSTGEILIKGENINGLSPREIRERRVAHIPEDRMENGVAEQTTLEENFTIFQKVQFKLEKNRNLQQ